MVALAPRIRKVLNKLDPMILPIEISAFFLKAATNEVESSGSHVPIERIVKPLIRSDIP